jgi:DNA (cytosine-5)-methyltransferase 1
VVRLNNNCDVEDVDSPLSTVTTSGAHHMICQPLVVDFTRNGKAKPANEPIGSQHCNDRFGMITPLIMGQQGCAAAKPIDEPCPTIATGGAVRVITPLILDMSRPGGNDSGHIRPANKPIQTLTTCDNVQGVFPMLEDGRLIDIRIRMLKPSELAKAHSFPDDYRLTGNRGEQVKQIGNSVPVMTACAMCEADLEGVR